MRIWEAILVAAPIVAGWRWHYVVHRGRWRRLEETLEHLAQKGPGGEALAFAKGDPALDSVRRRVEELVRIQAGMLQRIEHDEFSLRTVLESMEEGVLVADERQVVHLANPALGRIFRIKGPVVGRSVLEVLGEPEVFRLLQASMERGVMQQRQVEMVPGKGARHVCVHAVPMADGKGRPGVLAVFRDVTRLEELEGVRREFVANVSHELRTPLAIFHGYVENLIEMPELPEAERGEILGILRKHSLRLNALVEDLLSLARLEARRESFALEQRDLGELIPALLRDWRVRLQGQEVALEWECEPGLPEVRVDCLRIEQVLHNLLENALKHLPAKHGKIRVTGRREDAQVVVSVEDNGSGISPKDLPHIFERFYRADKSRTPRQGAHSSGLGLSIVKHIVAQHGGQVGAISPVNRSVSLDLEAPSFRGARVWFSLPAHGEELPRALGASLPEPPADAEKPGKGA
ncbi:MAG: hypothetical protein RLZZ142_1080 [Verrucomicrobiota bacterium]